MITALIYPPQMGTLEAGWGTQKAGPDPITWPVTMAVIEYVSSAHEVIPEARNEDHWERVDLRSHAIGRQIYINT